LAKTALNDPTHTAHEAELTRVTNQLTDRLTDLRTDTAIIGNNSLHHMHSMQLKNYKVLMTEVYLSRLLQVLVVVAFVHNEQHQAFFQLDHHLDQHQAIFT